MLFTAVKHTGSNIHKDSKKVLTISSGGLVTSALKNLTSNSIL